MRRCVVGSVIGVACIVRVVVRIMCVDSALRKREVVLSGWLFSWSRTLGTNCWLALVILVPPLGYQSVHWVSYLLSTIGTVEWSSNTFAVLIGGEG